MTSGSPHRGTDGRSGFDGVRGWLGNSHLTAVGKVAPVDPEKTSCVAILDLMFFRLSANELVVGVSLPVPVRIFGRYL